MIQLQANHILDFIRGLGLGICEFQRTSTNIINGIDQIGFDSGKSLGGIHGKPAFEALTKDNQTVELYDPAVYRKSGQGDQQKTKLGFIRKLLIVLGWLAFGVLAYCLFEFVLSKPN